MTRVVRMRGGGVFAEFGVLMILSLVALAMAAGGFYLLLSGVRQVRERKPGTPVPAGAVLRIFFGVLLLLPMAYWIFTGMAFSVGWHLGAMLIGSFFD